jgi:mRNA interferase MazF
VGKFVKGDVVVMPFPYSDLTSAKRRPALVVGELDGDDLVVCQITSKRRPADKYSIELTNRTMKTGHIDVDSWIKAGRIFTADSHLIVRKIGTVDDKTLAVVLSTIISIFS